MKADRQFDALNNGKRFPFRYDRRHQVNFTGTFKLSENINLSAAWSYHSGDAITLASAKYAAVASDDKQENGPYPFYTFNEDAYYYGAVNGARMRSFHRLDLSANFRKEKHKGFRAWEVSVVNVYNRKNPYFYYYGTISEIVSQNGTSRQRQRFFNRFLYSNHIGKAIRQLLKILVKRLEIVRLGRSFPRLQTSSRRRNKMNNSKGI